MKRGNFTAFIESSNSAIIDPYLWKSSARSEKKDTSNT